MHTMIKQDGQISVKDFVDGSKKIKDSNYGTKWSVEE